MPTLAAGWPDAARTRLLEVPVRRPRVFRSRGARALLAPLLPPVLVYRCWRTAARTGLKPLAPVLARALWLASAWSLGEAAGYLSGPGDAERHWRG